MISHLSRLFCPGSGKRSAVRRHGRPIQTDGAPRIRYGQMFISLQKVKMPPRKTSRKNVCVVFGSIRSARNVCGKAAEEPRERDPTSENTRCFGTG